MRDEWSEEEGMRNKIGMLHKRLENWFIEQIH